MEEVLTRAVCSWAGVEVGGDEVADRSRMLTELFEHAGSVGPDHWRSRFARRRADRWIAGMVRDVRPGRIKPPPDSALAVVAAWRDLEGALLPPRVAAVELLNLLRPTVAISVFVTFAAHALHHHPEWRERVQGDAEVAWFVQEVRRFYPFFPATMARLRRNVVWKDRELPAGRRTLLDLYGTNRDPRIWSSPDEFHPERFRDREIGAHELVPQGGGDHHLNHRCAGEWITIRLMETAVKILAREFSYEVPPQDLALEMARLPALPPDRFVITGIHPAETGQAR